LFEERDTVQEQRGKGDYECDKRNRKKAARPARSIKPSRISHRENVSEGRRKTPVAEVLKLEPALVPERLRD